MDNKTIRQIGGRNKMGMGTEDDHVANKKGVGSKENPESIRSDPNMGN